MALLTGIGFTMSLFIGTLAFPEAGYSAAVRVSVLTGSLVCAGMGYALLSWAGRRQARSAAAEPGLPSPKGARPSETRSR